MMQTPPFCPLEELAAQIRSESCIAVPSDAGGVAMAATRALLRGSARDLHLLGVPTSGLQADLLIGAGRLRCAEVSAVSLGEHGLAPRFSQAVKDRTIKVLDATCPAVYAALLASEKGVPFMPIRGLIGSDILRHRTDWSVIQNPVVAEIDPIVLIPAIRPDVALFHAPLADRYGNVWVGMRRELMSMAHASAASLITVESVQESNLLEDPLRAPAVIPAIYVTAVSHAPMGAWPLGLYGHYAPDDAHLGAYAKAARSEVGFADYLKAHVLPRPERETAR
jgi:glutaconate CoA-transferase subunit A